MSALVDVMSEYLFLLSEDENNLLHSNSFNFYLNSLIDGQRDKLTGGTKSGSWCVAPDDLMDSDARIDFIFKPTYLAVATLSIAKINYPLITNSIANYDEKLKNGLQFCTYRNLQGHGYDSIIQMIDAYKILSMGKVPLLLYRNPELSMDLKKVLDDVANTIALKLVNNDAIGAWGEDYSEGFSGAIETMILLNDEYCKNVFKNTLNDDYSIKKDQLKW
jgi:hypothetical protein